MNKRAASGFTLVELMIVIVVVAVLMGIALPAYRDQVIRGHRAAAKKRPRSGFRNPIFLSTPSKSHSMTSPLTSACTLSI